MCVVCLGDGVCAWDWTHSFLCLSWCQPLCFKTTVKVLFLQAQCALKYDGSKQMHLGYLLGIEMHCGKVSLWEYKGRGMVDRPTEGCTAHTWTCSKHSGSFTQGLLKFFLGLMYWLIGGLVGLFVETVSHTSPGWPELPPVLWPQPQECCSGRHEAPHPA